MHRYLLTFTGRRWGQLCTPYRVILGVYAECRVKAELVIEDLFDRVHNVVFLREV